MWLLTGLGNPGAKYAGNRHNIGFMAADAIADAYAYAPYSRKFGGEIADGRIAGQRALLFKPLTYMNLSGEAVGEALRFYKIPPERLIVFHDELDLPPGKLRVKQGGGNGGHNGLKNIDQHCGANYIRIRMGIGHPGDAERVTGYVLGDFSKEEQLGVEALLKAVSAHMPVLLTGDAPEFMNKVTLALA